MIAVVAADVVAAIAGRVPVIAVAVADAVAATAGRVPVIAVLLLLLPLLLLSLLFATTLNLLSGLCHLSLFAPILLLLLMLFSLTLIFVAALLSAAAPSLSACEAGRRQQRSGERCSDCEPS